MKRCDTDYTEEKYKHIFDYVTSITQLLFEKFLSVYVIGWAIYTCQPVIKQQHAVYMYIKGTNI